MTRRVYPNLAAFLKANPDITLEQLGREVGCSGCYISLIKNSATAPKHLRRQPSLALALRLADRCNVPLESLIYPNRKAG